MNLVFGLDHTRGLCGLPDVSTDTPRATVEARPAHCQCCGSAMEVKECSSLGLQQLGMYWLVCPACPPAPPAA